MVERQSDIVVIALATISAIVSIVTAVLAYLAQRSAKQAVQTGSENKIAIQTVSDNVDGKMEKLLQSTASASHAEGMVEGMKATAVVPVVVTNPDPVPVVVKEP